MTSLSTLTLPKTTQAAIAAKTPADYPALGQLVKEFDVYREGYAGKTVYIFRGQTTELCPLYADIGMTQRLDNPQVLTTRTDESGVTFGRFLQSVYVPYAYTLEIEGEENTGIQQVPLTSTDAERADFMVVTSQNSAYPRSIRERFSDYVQANDYGELSDSPATNTATLQAAISEIALRGGGYVNIPAGEHVFQQLSIPAQVILRGAGKDVTILKSQISSNVITMTGDNAGLEDITIDGATLLSGSVGIYGKALEGIALHNVKVKRFQTLIQWQGGSNHRYEDLDLVDANKGLRALGDSDSNGSGGGARFTGLYWIGGSVQQTTVCGIEYTVDDLQVPHNGVEQVDFLDNIGEDGALLVSGARFSKFYDCRWSGNTINLKVEDAADCKLDDYETISLQLYGGELSGGKQVFDGNAQDIIIDSVSLVDTTFELNVPSSQILLRDCIESGVLFTGDSTKISRFRTIDNGTIKGTTTDASVTSVYSLKLAPNEVVQFRVSATAERQNGTGKAAWYRIQAFNGQPALLNFDGQTVNYTVGAEVEGQTSGARGIIVAQTDSGTTGSIQLAAVSGEFVDNELVNEVDGTGSARANGTLTYQASQKLGAVTDVHAVGNNTGAPPAGWDLTFDVSGQEAHVYVTGAASNDIVWNLNIQVDRL